MVYLFQRPESMARAATKAQDELRVGAWLASLEFPVPDLAPTQALACRDGRTLWLYRMAAQTSAPPAAPALAGRARRTAIAPTSR